MSMKRILGTMLATRMAGRGRRRGALGTASAMGLLGSRRRRGGLGSKLGMAGLAYMAYQAYRSSQSRHAGQAAADSPAGGASGLIDKLRDTAQEIMGGSAGSTAQTRSADVERSSAADEAPDEQDLRDGEAGADRFSEDGALLLIRAMITAAYSDGSMSHEERLRIMEAIDEADATSEERKTMEREIANPKSLDELLTQVTDEETSEEFYFASRAALDGDSEADRKYLADLRDRLGLSPEVAAEADTIAS